MARLGYKKSKMIFGIHSLGMETSYPSEGEVEVKVGFNHPYEGWVIIATGRGESERVAFCEAMTLMNDELIRRGKAVVNSAANHSGELPNDPANTP